MGRAQEEDESAYLVQSLDVPFENMVVWVGLEGTLTVAESEFELAEDLGGRERRRCRALVDRLWWRC
jgi:hypothetical protein